MSRLTMLTATVAIVIASTAVIATAQSGDRAEGPKRGGDRAAMLIEEFDANGDGAISQEEIAAAQAARFAAADTNGDGALSVDELLAAQEERMQNRRAAAIERFIERFDTDGDGVLSPEEASELSDRRARMFDLADANDDGSVTLAELEELRELRRGFGRDRGSWWGRGAD